MNKNLEEYKTKNCIFLVLCENEKIMNIFKIVQYFFLFLFNKKYVLNDKPLNVIWLKMLLFYIKINIIITNLTSHVYYY